MFTIITHPNETKVTLSCDMSTCLDAIRNLPTAKEVHRKTIMNFLHEVQPLIRIERSQFFWHEIIRNMVNNLTCKNMDGLKKVLLSMGYKHPQAFEVMKDGFSEIIKNSIDAKMQCAHEGIKTDNFLKINIGFSIQQNDIELTIEDNAGGFSKDFLSKWNDYKVGKINKSQKIESAKSEEFFLGGKRRGMKIICYQLLFGIQKHPGLKFEKLCDIEPNTTDIQIANVNDGAQIKLRSPIIVIKDFEDSISYQYYREDEREPTDYEVFVKTGGIKAVSRHELQDDEEISNATKLNSTPETPAGLTDGLSRGSMSITSGFFSSPTSPQPALTLFAHRNTATPYMGTPNTPNVPTI